LPTTFVYAQFKFPLKYYSNLNCAYTLLCIVPRIHRTLTTRMPLLWLCVGLCGNGIGVVFL